MFTEAEELRGTKSLKVNPDGPKNCADVPTPSAYPALVVPAATAVAPEEGFNLMRVLSEFDTSKFPFASGRIAIGNPEAKPLTIWVVTTEAGGSAAVKEA